MAHVKNDQLEIMGLVVQARPEILLLWCVLPPGFTCWSSCSGIQFYLLLSP